MALITIEYFNKNGEYVKYTKEDTVEDRETDLGCIKRNVKKQESFIDGLDALKELFNDKFLDDIRSIKDAFNEYTKTLEGSE